MIKAVRIVCHGLSNGFRTPLSQSVQDSLSLPTPTQLIGLLGAASGTSRFGLSDLYSKFKVGVVGTYKTRFQDLTKVLKYASGGKIKNPTNPTSLLIRENLFDSDFTIWYLPQSDISVEYVKNSFLNPKYALSLGRDDEIIRIDEVRVVELREANESIIHDTIIPFILDLKFESIIDSDDTMFPLIPIQLPRSFDTDPNMVRTPKNFVSYVFIEGYKIKTTRSGALDDNGTQFFPL